MVFCSRKFLTSEPNHSGPKQYLTEVREDLRNSQPFMTSSLFLLRQSGCCQSPLNEDFCGNVPHKMPFSFAKFNNIANFSCKLTYGDRIQYSKVKSPGRASMCGLNMSEPWGLQCLKHYGQYCWIFFCNLTIKGVKILSMKFQINWRTRKMIMNRDFLFEVSVFLGNLDW